MLRKILSLVSIVSALSACSAASDPLERTPGEGTVDQTAEEATGENFTYFIVTRQDFRKCMYPICGGYYVKRVNRDTTRCADGTWQKECHVVDLDLSALGVSSELIAKFNGEIFGAGHGLVRGKLALVPLSGGLQAETLVGSEAWVGAADSAPDGTFYRVTDTGIQCITYPCPSFREAKLNGYATHTIHDVDLYVPGADDSEIGLGYKQMADKSGTLVAGVHYTFWGPAGAGKGLLASEFYLPLSESKYCASTTIYSDSSTLFYAGNFSSPKEAWNWLSTTFPNGVNSQVTDGPCNQPRACIDLYKPVCGAVKYDAPQTYSNSCAFESAVLGDAGYDGQSKGYYTDGACTTACNYDDPTKKYVAQSSEQCALVKFACETGYTPFFDDCGCGCALTQ